MSYAKLHSVTLYLRCNKVIRRGKRASSMRAHVLCSVALVKTAVRPSRGDKFHDCDGTSKCAGQVAAAKEKNRGRRKIIWIRNSGEEGEVDFGERGAGLL